MHKIKNNADGFADHLIFILIIVSVVGLIGFSGHKVWVNNTKNNKLLVSTSKPGSSSSNTNGTTQSTPKSVTIQKAGSAAAAVTPPTSTEKPTSSAVVSTVYPTTSAEGSLNQLIKELRSKNFQNALLFITPSFMSRTATLVQTNQQYVTLDACKANSICNNLLSKPFDELKAADTTVNHTSTTTTDGQRLTYYIGFRNNTYVSDLNKVSGDYTVSIDMVPASEHWLIDKITINDFSI